MSKCENIKIVLFVTLRLCVCVRVRLRISQELPLGRTVKRLIAVHAKKRISFSKMFFLMIRRPPRSTLGLIVRFLYVCVSSACQNHACSPVRPYVFQLALISIVTYCCCGWGEAQLADPCECGNEPSGSIKCGNIMTSRVRVSFSGRTLLYGVGRLFGWLGPVLMPDQEGNGSPATCNAEETGLPVHPVPWSPTQFSGSGPVGLPPVPWTEKTIKREVGRAKDLTAPPYVYRQQVEFKFS
jgi:hypothetical protein